MVFLALIGCAPSTNQLSQSAISGSRWSTNKIVGHSQIFSFGFDPDLFKVPQSTINSAIENEARAGNTIATGTISGFSLATTSITEGWKINLVGSTATRTAMATGFIDTVTLFFQVEPSKNGLETIGNFTGSIRYFNNPPKELTLDFEKVNEENQ